MHERQAQRQEQDDPIEGETDCDAKEREATTNIHRISRPSEHPGGRERQRRLRRPGIRANAPEEAVGADNHSDADNEGYGADHGPSRESNVG